MKAESEPSGFYVSVSQHLKTFFRYPRHCLKSVFLRIGLTFTPTRVILGRNFTPGQKIRFSGMGTITVGEGCSLGAKAGGGFWNSCCELQARYSGSEIVIGDNVRSNNGLIVIAAERVEIKEDVLIGRHVQISDSDAHDINPEKRRSHCGGSRPVVIGKNVWIGNNSIILKGASIGENSIVGAGSVVTGKLFPPNVIIAGNPARVVRPIDAATGEKQVE